MRSMRLIFYMSCNDDIQRTVSVLVRVGPKDNNIILGYYLNGFVELHSCFPYNDYRYITIEYNLKNMGWSMQLLGALGLKQEIHDGP